MIKFLKYGQIHFILVIKLTFITYCPAVLICRKVKNLTLDTLTQLICFQLVILIIN